MEIFLYRKVGFSLIQTASFHYRWEFSLLIFSVIKKETLFWKWYRRRFHPPGWRCSLSILRFISCRQGMPWPPRLICNRCDRCPGSWRRFRAVIFRGSFIRCWRRLRTMWSLSGPNRLCRRFLKSFEFMMGSTSSMNVCWTPS